MDLNKERKSKIGQFHKIPLEIRSLYKQVYSVLLLYAYNCKVFFAK